MWASQSTLRLIEHWSVFTVGVCKNAIIYYVAFPSSPGPRRQVFVGGWKKSHTARKLALQNNSENALIMTASGIS
jgi:hypothetical protein